MENYGQVIEPNLSTITFDEIHLRNYCYYYI